MSRDWSFGGCHCEKVRFKFRDDLLRVVQCNCSICSKKGFIHIIVAKEDFELLSGQESLTSYKFNTKTADHLFCKNCGISSYYNPRSHPDGYSINARCVDNLDLGTLEIVDFEGSSWEKNIANLAK